MEEGELFCRQCNLSFLMRFLNGGFFVTNPLICSSISSLRFFANRPVALRSLLQKSPSSRIL